MTRSDFLGNVKKNDRKIQISSSQVVIAYYVAALLSSLNNGHIWGHL